MDLGERERLVLHTIIQQYIKNSEPVGSRNVSKVGPLQMSPATIRNIMGDLEEKGYLAQPHTSAGRIPTDLGYRYYIDHLVAIEEIRPELETEVEQSLTFVPRNVPAMMKEFSRRLGSLTNSLGFVVTSNQDAGSVKQIEFTRLNKGSAVLAIIITKAGIVRNVLLNLPVDVTDSQLQYMGNYLTGQLSVMSISELKGRLASDYEQSVGEIRTMLSAILDIEDDVFSSDLFDDFFVMEGAANMLNFPEFQDVYKLKALLETLDEKKTLSDILERCMDNKGVQIFVGSEIGLGDMDEIGLVARSYEKKGNIVGMIGVIGPKRMPYPTVISVVDYSAERLAQMFSQLYGGYNGD